VFSEAETLEQTFERLADALFRYALLLRRNRGEAEEIVRDVFLSLSRKRRRDPLLDWFFFQSVRSFARKGACRVQEDIGLFDFSGDDVEERRVLQAAILGLPEEHREVVVLKIVCGLTLSEIGKVLDVSVDTISSRYHLALEGLSKAPPEDAGEDWA
jgi:DNA-directed RNA polymerase specialized sigma24 family protein